MWLNLLSLDYYNDWKIQKKFWMCVFLKEIKSSNIFVLDAYTIFQKILHVFWATLLHVNVLIFVDFSSNFSQLYNWCFDPVTGISRSIFNRICSKTICSLHFHSCSLTKVNSLQTFQFRQWNFNLQKFSKMPGGRPLWQVNNLIFNIVNSSL